MSSEQNFDLGAQVPQQMRVERVSSSRPAHVTPNVLREDWSESSRSDANNIHQLPVRPPQYRGLQYEAQRFEARASGDRGVQPPRRGLDITRQFGELPQEPPQYQQRPHLIPPHLPPTPHAALPVKTGLARGQPSAEFLSESVDLREFLAGPAPELNSGPFGPSLPPIGAPVRKLKSKKSIWDFVRGKKAKETAPVSPLQKAYSTETPLPNNFLRESEDSISDLGQSQTSFSPRSVEPPYSLGLNPSFRRFLDNYPAEQLDPETPRSYGRHQTYRSLFGSNPTWSIVDSFGCDDDDRSLISGEARSSGGSDREAPTEKQLNGRSATTRGFYGEEPRVGPGFEVGLGISAGVSARRRAQLGGRGSGEQYLISEDKEGKTPASTSGPLRSVHQTGRKVSNLRARFEQESNFQLPPIRKDPLSLTFRRDNPKALCPIISQNVSFTVDGDSEPPPIPRKSSKGVTAQHQSRYIPPNTPKRKILHSEERDYRRVNSESADYLRFLDEHQTPPHAHPDLRPEPLSIRKISDSVTPRSNEIGDIHTTTNSEDPFVTNRPIESRRLVVPTHQAPMETLQVSSAIRSSSRTKAVEDARAMQMTVIETCKKAGRDPPKYILLELIGKGSFGRVYKGKDVISTAIVAVKIIDIDEGDTLNPRLADTYSEFMKEVNALKILSESKARNINHVIEALPVGKAMWMITEYCGGGSIATLMKPTPTGLNERFIVPILREVAEAVKWVHQAGIIHRDLKCANILITEEGGVQLCDFGVAGITETALDKRSTFIGTFNWMAPELFQGSQYGTEVDIWAFGSMAYEMATGLPPNAMSGVSGMDLGPYLRTHIPRLEGGQYSDGLRGIVAFCLEENPKDRPTIEAVQRHSYIYNTNAKYPASSLSELVKAFKMWENHGGSRKSLFGVGGVQGPSEISPAAPNDDSWNFSTTAAFDQAVAQYTNAQDVINVYGSSVALSNDFQDETSRPSRQQQSRSTRRRPPPEALAPLKAPLEKLFDPNTISNYEDNARTHYNQHQNPVSDLPLRDDSAQNSIRDTMIDLDAHDVPSGLSSFSDMDTIKAGRRMQDGTEDDYDSGAYHDFNRPAFSDPADNPNRRTQDWKFPVTALPASANPELSRFPATYEPQRPSVTPASGGRPALMHHPTEPISVPTHSTSNLMPSAPSSPNRMSLIDLDLSLPEPSRPSTADSTTSQEVMSANPFHLESHTSRYHHSAREPSLYASDELNSQEPFLHLPDESIHPSHFHNNSNPLADLGEISDFSASDAESAYYDQFNGHDMHSGESSQEEHASGQSDYEYGPESSATTAPSVPTSSMSQPLTMAHFPVLPPPPSVAALTGTASHTEMVAELQRMIGGLQAQLNAMRDAYEAHPRPGGGGAGAGGGQ